MKPTLKMQGPTYDEAVRLVLRGGDGTGMSRNKVASYFAIPDRLEALHALDRAVVSGDVLCDADGVYSLNWKRFGVRADR